MSITAQFNKQAIRNEAFGACWNKLRLEESRILSRNTCLGLTSCIFHFRVKNAWLIYKSRQDQLRQTHPDQKTKSSSHLMSQ